jgi:hypothetical protein
MRRGTRAVQRRSIALAAVLSLGLALPLHAGGLPTGPPPPQAPLTLAAAVHSERADLDLALQVEPGAAPAEATSKPFFKTRRGVVTAVLMVAGLSWVFYSKSHDHVQSPANQ